MLAHYVKDSSEGWLDCSMSFWGRANCCFSNLMLCLEASNHMCCFLEDMFHTCRECTNGCILEKHQHPLAPWFTSSWLMSAFPNGKKLVD